MRECRLNLKLICAEFRHKEDTRVTVITTMASAWLETLKNAQKTSIVQDGDMLFHLICINLRWIDLRLLRSILVQA